MARGADALRLHGNEKRVPESMPRPKALAQACTDTWENAPGWGASACGQYKTREKPVKKRFLKMCEVFGRASFSSSLKLVVQVEFPMFLRFSE